jgi:hypothetical protein
MGGGGQGPPWRLAHGKLHLGRSLAAIRWAAGKTMANRVRYVGIFLFLGVLAHVAGRSAAFHDQTANEVSAGDRAGLACDLAYSIAAEIPGLSIKRSTGMFTDEALRRPVLGCRLAITGSFKHAPPGGDAANRLRDGFAAQGWQEMASYSADGKDGTAFAFRKTEVACLFRGTWNGGSDGEPPVPRGEAYRVSVLCTSPVPSEERIRQS